MRQDETGSRYWPKEWKENEFVMEGDKRSCDNVWYECRKNHVTTMETAPGNEEFWEKVW